MNSPVINIKKAVNSAFLLYTVFVLTACSSMPEISAVEPAGWESTIAQKQQIQQWGVKARLGIQSEHEGGSFDLFWDQDDDRYNIRLIAPFGQGAFNIAGNSEAVSIQTNQELTHHSTDPDRLFKRAARFGVAGLQFI